MKLLKDLQRNIHLKDLSKFAESQREDLNAFRPTDEEECVKTVLHEVPNCDDTSYHFGMDNFKSLYDDPDVELRKSSRNADRRKDLRMHVEFFDTYIIRPFQNNVTLVVIMADRGHRLPEEVPSSQRTA